MALAAGQASMMAADKVEFTRFEYNEGGYIYSTLCAPEEVPFATVKRGTGNTPGGDATFVLLSPDVQPVYSFTIKMPENMTGYAGSGAMYLVGRNTNYIQNILVTQHLFNDDDLYEVVISVNGVAAGPDIEDEEFWIYNEKGEYLGICPYDKLFQADGKYYIYSEYDHEIGDDYVSALYLPKKGGASVKEVGSPASTLKTTPNPVKYGDNVTVTIPEQAAGFVRVIGVDGTLLFSKSVEGNETEIVIPSYRLNAGVNPVVFVDADGNVLASGKIVRE